MCVYKHISDEKSTPEKMKQRNELEKLANTKLREYKPTSFKGLIATKKELGKSKARRVVKAKLVTIYSLWNKKLLCRTFYFEQYFEKKELHTYFKEIERCLAGNEHKLSRDVFYGGLSGMRIATERKSTTKNNWTGYYPYYPSPWEEWDIVENSSLRVYSNYQREVEVVGDFEHNSPLPYLKKSIHKYCGYELVREKYNNRYKLFDYLSYYEKHPQIELLAKFGIIHVLEDKRYIRWKCKGFDMLGITKEELPYIQAGIGLRDFRKLQSYVRKSKPSIEKVITLLEVTKNITNHEMESYQIEYLVKNNIRAVNYNDYLNHIDELDMKKTKSILCPKNFNKMHDKLSRRISSMKNEKYEKAIAKKYKEFKKFSFSNFELSIFPAKNSYEIVNEGNKLEHCVGSYVRKVAEENIEILLLRKKESIDEPYVTVELVGKKEVRQVHGYKNNVTKPLGKDVINFIYEWCEKFKFKHNLRRTE